MGAWSHPGGGYAPPKIALAPVVTWLRYVSILGPKSGPCSQKWLRLGLTKNPAFHPHPSPPFTTTTACGATNCSPHALIKRSELLLVDAERWQPLHT